MVHRGRKSRDFMFLASRLERILVRLVVISLVLLVTVQALLTEDDTRVFLSYTDRLEGVRWAPDESPQDDPVPSLEIEVSNGPSAPWAKVLVDGKEVASFRKKIIRVPVQDGQLVEIDGTRWRRLTKFRVRWVHPNMVEPRVGTEVITQGTIQTVGRVHLR